MNPKAYRLPAQVLPTRYDIELDARLGREDFHGKVAIQLDIRQSVSSIELHAVELVLSDARLAVGGKTLDGNIQQDADREMATISFGETLHAGPATLEIAFAGSVSKGLDGLYLAKDGPEQCLCTQCEETDARAIFPCFDEPTFKAQFAWKITTAPDVTVLANGPRVSVESSDGGNSKTWTFAPTKKMSSYLIALVIGDVASTPEEEVNGTPLRVYALRGKEHMGRFARDFTKRLLPWYEEYFAAPYHFDKYDQVAVPGFAAGAMENSGLVLFRQSLLLLNPQTSSWNAEKSVAHVVAHEFAHMWFGNLVTMKWWDDLWLNEAFAEWMSYKAIDALSPEYELWNDFQSGRIRAMSSDALESTHPIYSKVETPAEAAEMFDVITYEKGCAVMRMLESFLGEDAFRAGMRTYMKEFAEGNAAGADLWRHMETAAGHPVTQIMNSWVAQGGYPIVRVSLEGATLKLSQKRFFSSPSAGADNTQTWHVPLIVRYEDDKGIQQVRHLLSEREGTISLDVQGDLKWVHANADEIGFYRQDLDEELQRRLLANIDKLSPMEQMGLLSDQWAVTRNGTQPITRFLAVESSMMDTQNYNVLDKVVGYLYNLEWLLEDAADEAAMNNFRAWVDSCFKKRMAQLSYEPKAGESQNDAQSRVSLVAAMTLLAQDEEAQRQAREWADKEAQDPSAVDANLAGLYVAASARSGDLARFERYVDIYKQRKNSASSPQERDRYLNSFGFFKQPQIVAQTLQLMEDRTIPQEAVMPMLRTMLGQRHTQLQAWDFMRAHWDYVLTLGTLSIPDLVGASGNLPASRRDELVEFYDKNLNGMAEQSYARAIETMDQLDEFSRRARGGVVEWFARQT